jgi:tRNA threonylcarbamoyladenosine dehydratase
MVRYGKSLSILQPKSNSCDAHLRVSGIFITGELFPLGFYLEENMFERLLKIIDQQDLTKISQAKVLLVGVGGVGGYALETMVRMGILDITIVDNDLVDLTNLNRQIISLHSNIKEAKVDVAERRGVDINPQVKITKIKEFITKDNIDALFNKDYDYIIDACDTVTTKVALIKKAEDLNIKIISCMGTGNRLDPTKVVIKDIYETNYDPLAKVMRHLLRENKIKKLPVVTSEEQPIKTDTIPGSSALVPSVAGIYCTYFIINDILKR